MNKQIFEDSLYLLEDGWRETDHPIYKIARLPENKIFAAKIMAASTSEIQTVKYLQFAFENRPIEPGFRTKAMDALLKERSS